LDETFDDIFKRAIRVIIDKPVDLLRGLFVSKFIREGSEVCLRSR